MMVIKSRIEVHHIAVIILLLVLLYWLLLPAVYPASDKSDSHVHKHSALDIHGHTPHNSDDHKIQEKPKLPIVEERKEEREDVNDLQKLVYSQKRQIEDLHDEIDEMKGKGAEEIKSLKEEKEMLMKNMHKSEKDKSDQLTELDKKIKDISAESDKVSKQNKQLTNKHSTSSQSILHPFKGLKLVHFDLKGAPPKIDYLIEVMKDSKKFGAHGFLIEYEDMFPWHGDFKHLAAKNAYTVVDIKRIIKTASDKDMIVIPLVQTYGHMEFVLKHKTFAHLRGNREISTSICPFNNASIPLIKKMLDQVIELHPDSQWFHLGGDEVWNIKTCELCVSSNLSDAQIYKKHMLPLLQYVRGKETSEGEQMKAIIWDDMMRRWDVPQLKEMAKYVSPMVWAYVANLEDYTHFPDDIWDRYTRAFPEIWLASSFKGALKPWSNFVPMKQHLDNHLSWLKITADLQQKETKVTGIVLTGWSRFDHYGPMCELLPAGIPSLALNLAVLDKGGFDQDLYNSVSKHLGFNGTFKISVPSFMKYKPENATFHGADVYYLVGSLEKAIGWKDWSFVRETGWTRPYQLRHNHASYYHMNTTRYGVRTSIKLLRHLQEKAPAILSKYFYTDMVDEWVTDKIDYNIHKGYLSIKVIKTFMKKAKFD